MRPPLWLLCSFSLVLRRTLLFSQLCQLPADSAEESVALGNKVPRATRFSQAMCHANVERVTSVLLCFCSSLTL